MADRTGIAQGTLRPCIYFVRRTDMYAILAPVEQGGGPELARWVYETKFKTDWEWCEATTLAEVDRLQTRLTNQAIFERQKMVEVNQGYRDFVHKQTGDRLRQQMVSSETSQWEKDAISFYLKLRNEKRDYFRNAIEHHNMFIAAREMDSGTKLSDFLPTQPDQFERTRSGGTPTEVLQKLKNQTPVEVVTL